MWVNVLPYPESERERGRGVEREKERRGEREKERRGERERDAGGHISAALLKVSQPQHFYNFW